MILLDVNLDWAFDQGSWWYWSLIANSIEWMSCGNYYLMCEMWNEYDVMMWFHSWFKDPLNDISMICLFLISGVLQWEIYFRIAYWAALRRSQLFKKITTLFPNKSKKGLLKCTMQSPMLCFSKKHTFNLNLDPLVALRHWTPAMCMIQRGS